MVVGPAILSSMVHASIRLSALGDGLRRIYTTKPSREPSTECKKFICVDDKKYPPSTNRAIRRTIRGGGIHFLSVFLPNTEGFRVMSGLQFLPICRFCKSDEIYASQTSIIAWRTTSNLKICPNVRSRYKPANIGIMARLARLSVPSNEPK